MSSNHEEHGCCSGTGGSGTAQTLDEMAFERGVWTAAIDGDSSRLRRILGSARDRKEEANARDSSGLTALHYAARSGSLECAQILLESGCQVNAMSNSGATPLHRAAYMGHTDIIQLLIGHGCDLAAVDDDGKTPLHKCTEKGHQECASLILKATPSPDSLKTARDRRGRTPLDCCDPSNKSYSQWRDLLSLPED